MRHFSTNVRVLLVALLLLTGLPEIALGLPPAPPVLLAQPAVSRGVVDEAAARAPGQVVVKFRASLAGNEIEAARANYRLSPPLAAAVLGAQLVQVAVGDELDVVRRLQNDPRVEFAEPNYLVRASATTPLPQVAGGPAERGCIPSDFWTCPPTPGPTTLTPTDPLYASSQPDLPLIGMPSAWGRTLGASGVVTAVIDTGAAFSHPDLAGRLVSLTGSGLPGADHVFIHGPSGGCTVPPNPDDDAWGAAGRFTHGTHVTGTVVARSTLTGDPAEGVAGLAPGARVAPLKVLDCEGSGTGFDVAGAITFAAQRGAKVINMSLGSDGNSSACPSLYQSAITTAHNLGVVIFAAAGNDGTANRSIPANCQFVVGVGATTNSDAKASFSQFNDTVDVSAPGVGTMSTFRDNSGAYVYRTLNGTSMATPHVAGCAALMLSIRPGLTPEQIESILRTTSVDLGAAGRDDLFGSGRIDCGAAVQRAAITTPGTVTVPTLTPTRTPTTSQGGCGSYGATGEPVRTGGTRLTPATPLAARVAPPLPSTARLQPPERAEVSRGTRAPNAFSEPYQPGRTMPQLSAAATTTIVCETFEGTWPNGTWSTFDGNGAATGSQCWGTDEFQAYQSNRAAWPAKGCADGVDPTDYLYGSNYDSWMVVGPFDLSGATTATVRFRLWHQLLGQITGGQPVGDYLFWGASRNGTDFYGNTVVGNSTTVELPTAEGWLDVTFDLGAVPSLGSLAGQSQVWMGWHFVSDAESYDDGPFVDDVFIRKGVADVPTPTATPTPSGPVGGRDFAIRIGALGYRYATWTDGLAETGYLAYRWTPNAGITTIPATGVPLAADATDFLDTTRVTDPGICYLLAALGGLPPSPSVVRGQSDLLCVVPTDGGGVSPPSDFRITLGQSSTAIVSWATAAGHTGYELVITRGDGSNIQTVPLPPSTAVYTHPTNGQPTCYMARSVAGATVLGTTMTLCAVPGVTSLASLAALR